jgi:2-keto-4-pentenoate hydratase/2-oxohepta-3-ene-1,7-dioic acid hydratase in catechol pathway
MQLLSFHLDGAPSYGVVRGDRILDLGRRLSPTIPSLRHAIAAGLFRADFESPSLDDRDPALRDVRLLPPITEPSKIICVGRNYRGHVAEAGLKLPEFPSLFIRVLDSIVAHGGALIRPRASHQLDFEGELAVVIGKPGRDIPPDTALDHVFGYSCFNDGSLRDFQMKHSLTIGKNFQSTGGFGPYIATASVVGDPRALEVRTHVNGTEMQHGKVSDLIFDIPYLIAYISRFTILRPGDVIATGTPDGVGFVRTPPIWLQPGDEVAVSIPGVGELRNSVADAV